MIGSSKSVDLVDSPHETYILVSRSESTLGTVEDEDEKSTPGTHNQSDRLRYDVLDEWGF